jgi:hypothetical protein
MVISISGVGVVEGATSGTAEGDGSGIEASAVQPANIKTKTNPAEIYFRVFIVPPDLSFIVD